MLNSKRPDEILFLDIETTSVTDSFFENDEKYQHLFLQKTRGKGSEVVFGLEADLIKKEAAKVEYEEIIKGKDKPTKADKDRRDVIEGEITELKTRISNLKQDLWDNNAPIFVGEFGKIICVSVGILFPMAENKYGLKITSFNDADEKVLLTNFVTKLSDILNLVTIATKDGRKKQYAICSHNGKMFDMPGITKRLIINGIPLPKAFDYFNEKPWTLNWIIDTMEMWKMTVRDGGASLDLLAKLFNVESSKEGEVKGEYVKRFYYNEKDGLKKITEYCEKDIFTLVNVYMHIVGMGQTEVVRYIPPQQ